MSLLGKLSNPGQASKRAPHLFRKRSFLPPIVPATKACNDARMSHARTTRFSENRKRCARIPRLPESIIQGSQSLETNCALSADAVRTAVAFTNSLPVGDPGIIFLEYQVVEVAPDREFGRAHQPRQRAAKISTVSTGISGLLNPTTRFAAVNGSSSSPRRCSRDVPDCAPCWFRGEFTTQRMLLRRFFASKRPRVHRPSSRTASPSSACRIYAASVVPPPPPAASRAQRNQHDRCPHFARTFSPAKADFSACPDGNG